ncbi:hypothetical protein [Maribacter litoralis]|uniref:hypothetical protein n=1 Tax=Maribacter litoralis TaxID=2059726 RepID=UPI0013DFCA2D|nr:hypothetical protein [Maribacter litoralis]
MKLIHILVALLLTITSVSCQQEKRAADDDVTVMWASLLSDLAAEDKEAFKEASAETIRCYDCLENTPSEVQHMNLLRENDSLWYSKIYEDLIYIPIDSFIANDYDTLFNPKFVKILQENETIISSEETNGVTYAHILVTTTLPTAFFEGAQHIFSFVKNEDDVWKLNEIGTIP